MKSKSLATDILKFLLAIMVVGLHAGMFGEYGKVFNYFFASGIFRLAVPTFFLISGYYFSQNISLARVKKWSKRILYLFLFWNTFFILIYFLLSSFDFKKILLFVFVGYHHLWFVQALLIAGVLLFILKYFLKLSDDRLLVFSFSLYLLGVIIQYVMRFDVFELDISKSNSVHLLYRNGLFFAFPLISLGYYSKVKEVNSIPIYWVIASIVLFLMEIFLSVRFMNPLKGIEMHLALYPLSVIIFVNFKNAIKKSYSPHRIDLGMLSSAVFFVHPLFVMIGGKLSYGGVYLFLFSLFVSLVFSFFAIIPIHKRILPFIL